jgi:hypothetical protein
MPGSVCGAGVCGVGPHALTYDFENGLSLPTTLPPSPCSAATWSVVSGGAHGGTYSLRSGTIGLGSFSSIVAALAIAQPATLSLWYRIDGDPCCDHLDLVVDGANTLHAPFSSTWTMLQSPIFPGRHSFELRFTHGSTSTMSTAYAYVDDLSLTANDVGPVCAN